MRVSLFPLLIASLSFIAPAIARPQDVPTDGSVAPTDGTGTDGAPTDGTGTDGTDTGVTPTDGATTPDSTGTEGGVDGGTTGGNAGIEPTEPFATSVYNAGSQITAKWNINPDGDQWTNMTITLMTGSNFNMQALKPMASNINAMMVSEASFPAPEVHPYSRIYFLEFTNVGFNQKLWTTRFAIADATGATVPPQFNQTDANGVPQTDETGNIIQWGNGALGPASANGTMLPSPTAPDQKGVGPNGITLYTQGINTGTEAPPGVTISGVAAATLGAKGPSNGAARAAATPIAFIGAVVAAAAFLA